MELKPDVPPNVAPKFSLISSNSQPSVTDNVLESSSNLNASKRTGIDSQSQADARGNIDDFLVNKASYFLADPVSEPSPTAGGQQQLENDPLTNSQDRIQASQDNSGVNNSLTNARDIGRLSGEQKFSGFVGDGNKKDLYRFTLDSQSNFSLLLDGLKDDADVEIIEDKNNNGVVDEREVVRTSHESNTTREEIQFWGMTPGTYYVRVNQFSGNTPYNLSLTAKPFTSPPDTAGNSIKDARDLGTIKGPQSLIEYLWAGDSVDYYRFQLDEPSSFALAIAGLSSTVDVDLLQDTNNNGAFDEDEMLRRDYTEGISPKELQFWRLEAGTYYIRTAYEYPGATSYSLTVAATPALTPPPDGAGNTLREARDLGNLDRPVALNDSVWFGDRSDDYRFHLDTPQDLNLQLASVEGNADVQLIRDANNNGLVEENEVVRSSTSNPSAPGQIKFLGLQPGNYYVGVTLKSRDTNYNLALATTPASGFNSDYGYGLVNAAAAVSSASGVGIAYSDRTALAGNDWGRQLIHAPEVWNQGNGGEGVVVAVLDTGVDYNHPDLADNIWINSREIPGNGIDDDGNGFVDDVRGWDFVDNDSNPMDETEHGTHVAGIIAAEKNDVGITGVAYGAKIMPVRIADQSGGASARNFVNGVHYAVDNGAKVINISLGGGPPNRDREDAIKYAISKGVVVVMAAGNEGETEPAYPARYASQLGIAVGSVNIKGKMALASNRAGSQPLTYLLAPGVDIVSTVPDNQYKSITGTSMATPHVVGVVALMLSANPNLTPDQISKILLATASSSGLDEG